MWNWTRPSTRDWQKANQRARQMEVTGEQGDCLIEKACQDFLSDCLARGLRESSLYKYRLLLSRLQMFAKDKGLGHVRQFNLEMAAKFRESWTNKGTAARKKLESLRTFFKFCHQRGWIDSNPAASLKMPNNTEPPIEPFTQDQMTAILGAIPHYPTRGTGKINAVRLRALVLLLRYSGLRIGDAVTISRDRIDNGRLFLRTAKTGTRVFVPLPNIVTDALGQCPGKQYPFWTGDSKRKSVIGNWQRALGRLFELANIDGHAHRFRHTFACELLMAGATMTNVSQLLGHSSEKVTERHYSAWVKGRQEMLEVDVRRAWGSVFDSDTVTKQSQSRKKQRQNTQH